MISFVVPLYNEEENIRHLIGSIIRLRDKKIGDSEIILVDDNSSDDTAKIIDRYSEDYKFIVPLHRKKGKNGMGYALIDGTKKAKGDIVFWIMGDNSDDLNAISNMLGKIEEGYDMVFGSRYMGGGSKGDLSIDKAILGSIYTRLCRLLFRIDVHDITNAFRGFRKCVFDSMKLESGDFAISPEFAIKAKLKGYKLGEVPITYFNRSVGKTNFKLLKMGIRYVRLFKFAFIRKNNSQRDHK